VSPGRGPVNGDLLLRHPEEAVTPNDFGSLDALSRTLLAFVDRYNQTARPFSWKFTAADLRDLMDRISRHEQQDTQDEPLPKAA
jgi:hypothetical protein